jgi:RNA polymerase sigma-70 factor (ECF subfamily)
MQSAVIEWSTQTDAALLLSGEREAFGVFYDRHVQAVMRYHLLRTACVHTAADLTADTFAQALVSQDKYRDPGGGDADGWLFVIARRQFQRLLRRRRAEARAVHRLGMMVPTVDDDSYERIDELVDFKQLRPRIERSLAELPPAWAAAVTLRVIDGLSYPTVAAQLGCSEQAARVKVCRALNRMSALLERGY